MNQKPPPYELLISIALTTLIAVASPGNAQNNSAPLRGAALLQAEERVNPNPNKRSPIAADSSLFLEELPWLEVRDALREGKTTIIIPTGGVEMSGPYVAVGKHNFILHVITQRIAQQLGNALIAPVVPFVPQGEIDPPSGNMRYPGTLSVRETTFRALLTDIANSLRVTGFRNIILIGDSGGNQDPLQQVADSLAQQWQEANIYYIPEYFGYQQWFAYLEEHENIQEVNEGIHDTFRDTALMMLYDPNTVRAEQRQASDRFSVNGVPLAPVKKTLAVANRLADYQARLTVDAIQHAIDSVAP